MRASRVAPPGCARTSGHEQSSIPPGKLVARDTGPPAPLSTTRTGGELELPRLELTRARLPPDRAACRPAGPHGRHLGHSSLWTLLPLGDSSGDTAQWYWIGISSAPRQATSPPHASFFLHAPEHLTINRSMPAEGPRRSRLPYCWRVSSLAPEASQRNGKQTGSWSWTLPLEGLPAICPGYLLLS